MLAREQAHRVAARSKSTRKSLNRGATALESCISLKQRNEALDEAENCMRCKLEVAAQCAALHGLMQQLRGRDRRSPRGRTELGPAAVIGRAGGCSDR